MTVVRRTISSHPRNAGTVRVGLFTDQTDIACTKDAGEGGLCVERFILTTPHGSEE